MKKLNLMMLLLFGLFLITSCSSDDDGDGGDVAAKKNLVMWQGDTLEVTHALFAGSVSQDTASLGETSIVLWLDNTGHNICWLTCKNNDLGKLIMLNGAGENYEIYLDVNDKRKSWYRHDDDEAFGMGNDSYIKINHNGKDIYSIDVRKSTTSTLYVHYVGPVNKE